MSARGIELRNIFLTYIQQAGKSPFMDFLKVFPVDLPAVPVTSGLHMRAHVAKKVQNVVNNTVIKCVITALSICTSKNSVFPDFAHLVEPEIRIFLH